jgi:hypothetical protein
MFATVNTKKNSCPIGYKNKDQVISLSPRDGVVERAPGPGLKPQDNNASFEGISEAEYNKRHMKALKDADPGLKLQASSFKRQAQIKNYNKRQAPSSKRQASSHKRQAP